MKFRFMKKKKKTSKKYIIWPCHEFFFWERNMLQRNSYLGKMVSIANGCLLLVVCDIGREFRNSNTSL